MSRDRTPSPGPHDRTQSFEWNEVTKDTKAVIVLIHGRESCPEDDWPIFEPTCRELDEGKQQIAVIALRAQDQAWCVSHLVSRGPHRLMMDVRLLQVPSNVERAFTDSGALLVFGARQATQNRQRVASPAFQSRPVRLFAGRRPRDDLSPQEPAEARRRPGAEWVLAGQPGGLGQ